MIHAAQIVLLLAFPALVIVAALKDLTSYTIPNWIAGAMIIAFAGAAFAMRLPLFAVGLDVAVGLVALVAGMAMFAFRWIGGGDAKLFAAAALWLGLSASLTYLFYTALAGGLLAVSLLCLRSARVRAVMPDGPAWFARLAEPGAAVPYGVAIAVGALAAFPLSGLMTALAAHS